MINPVNRKRGWEHSHPKKAISKECIDSIIKNVGGPDESFTSMVEFLLRFYLVHKDDAGVTR